MLQDIYPHRFHIEFSSKKASPNDFLICCSDGNVYINHDENGICFPKVKDAKLISEPFFLFSIDDMLFFTAECEDITGCEAVAVRSLRHAEPQWLAFAGIVGFRLCDWYERNHFCGRCAARLEHGASERSLCCPKCGNVIYPTICPSVIVAVRNGSKLLLTRYQQSHSTYRHYALCAGYIETGESAEDAVRRELMEEVGLRVKNISYYKSQPWPLSGALLIGFFCDVDGSDAITRDESELSEAVWIDRADMPDRSNDVSLTSEMMEQFRMGLK